MAIQTITYANKSYINQNSGIADTNKINDTDMNEIKSVVNNNSTELSNLQGTTLFSNSTGSISVDISFNEDISNYKTLAIVYDKGLIQNIDVETIINKNADIPLSMYWHDGTSAGGVFGAFYYLTNTQLTYRTSIRFYYYSGSSTPTIDTQTSIHIYKVIGYK